MTYDAVRAATGAPVLVGSREIRIPEERIDGRLDDGAEVPVGGLRIGVIHTPGHTPGSISLHIGRAVITGDTLFRGGPGKTSARGELETIMASITRSYCHCRKKQLCFRATVPPRRSPLHATGSPRTTATPCHPASMATSSGVTDAGSSGSATPLKSRGLRLGTARGRWVLTATVLGSAMAQLDATVVGIAQPAIGKEFHAQIDGVAMGLGRVSAHSSPV